MNRLVSHTPVKHSATISTVVDFPSIETWAPVKHSATISTVVDCPWSAAPWGVKHSATISTVVDISGGSFRGASQTLRHNFYCRRYLVEERGLVGQTLRHNFYCRRSQAGFPSVACQTLRRIGADDSPTCRLADLGNSKSPSRPVAKSRRLARRARPRGADDCVREVARGRGNAYT